VVFYLAELAQQFHSYFTRLKCEGDPILPTGVQLQQDGWRAAWDRDKTLARLLWIRAIENVYGAGLRLLGITALRRMDPLVEQPSPAAGAEKPGGAEAGDT